MSAPPAVLLDTTVLIDTLRNRNQRRQLLAGLVVSGHALAVSTISIAEVYSGVRAGEEQATHTLLVNLNWIPVSGAIAERAGRLKAAFRSQGQTRSIADMIVAATALENGCTVATDNRKDFQMLGLTFVDLP
jgi:predicted nucleic acid-binding protein